jgi:hypothetical protein
MRSLKGRIEKLEHRVGVRRRVVQLVIWDGKEPLPPAGENVIQLVVSEAGGPEPSHSGQEPPAPRFQVEEI